MGKWAKRIVALLLVGYAGMCTLAKFDGGASKGMPSNSAAEAASSGMLVKRLTVITDSDGPAGIHDAWLEIPAATGYRLGFWPYRRPLVYFDEGTRYLLSVAIPNGVELGDGGHGNPTKSRLGRDGAEVVAFDIVGMVPDTIILRAKAAGTRSYPLVFSDGRPVADAAPPRN
jgi:hypothetical protein